MSPISTWEPFTNFTCCKHKKEAMDVAPFELEDPTDVVQVILRVKEEMPDVKELLYEPLQMENPPEFVPVLGIKEELPDVKDLVDQPSNFENHTEFVRVSEIKEEFPDVKDELLPYHYLESPPAQIMDGCSADGVNIKSEDWPNEDPLSIVEKHSGCDSAGKASCNYKPSERTPLDVAKCELYSKRETSKNKDFNNSALYNEGEPAKCVPECAKTRKTLQHLGERQYICDECEKCFTVRRSFLAHLLIHSGERKHKCMTCEKCFTHRSHLVRHYLIHTGERKHKCEDCGKCFTRRADLVNHSLIHSGVRKHKCDECGKCFIRRSGLVCHSAIHSGEKKHECEVCGKCFAHRSNLIHHLLIHSNERK